MISRAVLSPHLDDAALSASTQLGPECTVVTVFTAVPPVDWPITQWDRLTGASSSHVRQHERRAEDAAAMRILRSRSIYLEELELRYRTGPPDLSGALSWLAQVFGKAQEVWLPAAIAEHPDHRLARDIGLLAAQRAAHTHVIIYADYPYILVHGWPAFVTGEPSLPFLDVDSWLDHQLTSVGLQPQALRPEWVKLSVEQRARKKAVIAAYQSQAKALALGPDDLALHPGKLDYELYWRMPVSFADSR